MWALWNQSSKNFYTFWQAVHQQNNEANQAYANAIKTFLASTRSPSAFHTLFEEMHTIGQRTVTAYTENWATLSRTHKEQLYHDLENLYASLTHHPLNQKNPDKKHPSIILESLLTSMMAASLLCSVPMPNTTALPPSLTSSAVTAPIITEPTTPLSIANTNSDHALYLVAIQEVLKTLKRLRQYAPKNLEDDIESIESKIIALT